jgi:hypothetical protein
VPFFFVVKITGFFVNVVMRQREHWRQIFQLGGKSGRKFDHMVQILTNLA